MGQYIVKLTDKKAKKEYYMEWSTVVDSPTTNGMSLEDFKLHYKNQYGASGVDGLEKRLIRVEEKGCSSHAKTENAEWLIKNNSAGNHGKKLSLEGLLDMYCRE